MIFAEEDQPSLHSKPADIRGAQYDLSALYIVASISNVLTSVFDLCVGEEIIQIWSRLAYVSLYAGVRARVRRVGGARAVGGGDSDLSQTHAAHSFALLTLNGTSEIQ